MSTTSQGGDETRVELLFNDLSIHGQFHSSGAFRDALETVMAMRQTARRFGRELYCHRNVIQAQVTMNRSMQMMLRTLRVDQRRALMQWLTRYGPFWTEDRHHLEDDWFEYNGEIITDTAIGEAAHNLMYGKERALVSINPSSWLISPLPVIWRDNQSGKQLMKTVEVGNYWNISALETALVAAPSLIRSWKDLETAARVRCLNLAYSSDSFQQLEGHPFNRGAADRLLERLAVLHDLKGCFDSSGRLTSDGHRLYDKHFTGDKAWFSDSSRSEKARFEKELTFRHPSNGEYLFCPWHGKVKSPQLRIHFSWPIRADEPLYIVYIGPKITIR